MGAAFSPNTCVNSRIACIKSLSATSLFSGQKCTTTFVRRPEGGAGQVDPLRESLLRPVGGGRSQARAQMSQAGIRMTAIWRIETALAGDAALIRPLMPRMRDPVPSINPKLRSSANVPNR